MSEQSTTPDLAELTRRQFEAVNSGEGRAAAERLAEERE